MRAKYLFVALVLATGCSGAGESISGDLAEFCELMLNPPGTGAFRDPSDTAERETFDAHIAAVHAVAPPAVRSDAGDYRASVRRYLDGRASGSNDREAEQLQAEAGQAVNDFVDDRCF